MPFFTKNVRTVGQTGAEKYCGHGYMWMGRKRFPSFSSCSCGRAKTILISYVWLLIFVITKKKSPFSKICGYIWTRPYYTVIISEILLSSTAIVATSLSLEIPSTESQLHTSIQRKILIFKYKALKFYKHLYILQNSSNSKLFLP